MKGPKQRPVTNRRPKRPKDWAQRIERVIAEREAKAKTK